MAPRLVLPAAVLVGWLMLIATASAMPMRDHVGASPRTPALTESGGTDPVLYVLLALALCCIVAAASVGARRRGARIAAAGGPRARRPSPASRP
jgi:hypothetical protein